MTVVYTLILLAVAFPWFLDARSAWRRRRIVRMETRRLDEELAELPPR